MSCASCAAKIERALKKQEGVLIANVNFAAEKANVEFDEEKIALEKIHGIIKKLGYKLAAEDKSTEEVKKPRNKFLFSLIFGIPLFYLVMGKMVGLPVPSLDLKINIIIQFAITTVIMILNRSLYISGLKKFMQFSPNMDSLVEIGTFAAYFYSIVVSINAWFNASKEMHLYFESVAFILVFISLGKYLESLTKGKTSQAIKKLMKLQPKIDVKKGEVVLVKPGEAIPADGIVVDGYSTVDESMITGESMPVDKKNGDEVIGGTINKTGAFKFKATKVGSETMLAQIIKIVESAISSKAPIQLLADKTAFYFVPAVMMGTGLAAQSGILIKNAKALEAVHKVTMVVFDKTGTLTKGEPCVTDIIGDVLQIAASVEQKSEHPLARAIVNKAKKEKLELFDVSDFEAIPGKGVRGIVNGREVLVGNRKLIKSDIGENLEDDGKTVMVVSADKKPIGAIAVADTLKENSKQAVSALHKLNKKTAIITGDNKKSAEAIAKEVGIDYVLADVLPQEKSSEIKRLRAEEHAFVAMVGDGINDAPALASADVGIVLGSGSDIAMETGDIVLIKDDLRDVVRAIEISEYTLKKIKQNLFWAFFYNSAGIPIAAGILYPFTGRLLSPVIASAAMAFSSVSVVSNALLTKRYHGTSAK